MILKNYTKTDLEKLVNESSSLAGVLKKLNIKSYRTLKKAIEKYSIDTSHFTGQGHLKGKTHQHNTKPLDEILVRGKVKSSNEIKKRLFRDGIKEEKCENCKLKEWCGSKIPLELHHVDGDKENNELQNLMILCANCHALTDNYRGKNKNRHKKDLSKKIIQDEELKLAVEQSKNISQVLLNLGLCSAAANYQTIKNRMTDLGIISKFYPPEIVKICPYCKIEFISNKTFCSIGCANRFNKNGLKTAKVKNRPTKEVLLQIINSIGYSATGRMFNVSNSAIKKWLR